MRALITILACCTLCVSIGCQANPPTEIYSSFGPGVRPDGLGSTFSWSPAAAQNMKAQEKAHPLVHSAILDAVDTQMKKKGYRTEQTSPELWLTYEVNASEQVDGLSAEAYLLGVYGLSIFDPATSKKIYSAAAKIRVNTAANADEARATVNEATRRMLEKFPNVKR